MQWRVRLNDRKIKKTDPGQCGSRLGSESVGGPLHVKSVIFEQVYKRAALFRGVLESGEEFFNMCCSVAQHTGE